MWHLRVHHTIYLLEASNEDIEHRKEITTRFLSNYLGFWLQRKGSKYSSSRICTTDFLQSRIQKVMTESPVSIGLWQDNSFSLHPLDRNELLFLDVSYSTEFSGIRHNNGKSADKLISEWINCTKTEEFNTIHEIYNREISTWYTMILNRHLKVKKNIIAYTATIRT